eukprot:CAMPEP_0113944878 /NCGR_PEP_ID=MMETSP1339-20121228/37496_1 /TAXON_ID=94617 /ORGANISM="Fibrocapsa japonica" /LENGTH=181 /DNA_ID=CAMNT_0000950221 /DNA_START=103 /DNA_END=648 /DNA_ORIENTATION=+ /assembly_acc=CAM_ASM_000762
MSKSQLNLQASKKSGVPFEHAKMYEEMNIWELLGGEEGGALEVFKQISTNFYDRVFNDDQEWFRSIFSAVTRSEATRNQYEFLAEKMGGPKLYSARKGKSALIGRHGPYAVTDRAAGRWLEHMRAALDDVTATGSLEDDLAEAIWLYLKHTAYYITTGRELINTTRLVGYGATGGGGYHHG